MELIDALRARHSVRNYFEREIEAEIADELQQAITEYNDEGGLNIQLCQGEPAAFKSLLASYGSFRNVNNYLALVGPKTEGAEENCGYYGQKLVLLAQKLGLNSCWVGASYRKGKSAAVVGENEKLYLVVSLGYGQDQGKPRKSKPMDVLSKVEGNDPCPDWFTAAMEAAMLAPTAMNQQKFLFTLKGTVVDAQRVSGFFSKTDLGIVKYNFEVGAQAAGARLGQDWHWENVE